MNKFFETKDAGELFTTAQLLVLCSTPLIVVLYALEGLTRLMR